MLGRLIVVLGVVALASCAGQPSQPRVASTAKAACEPTTGSRLCADDPYISTLTTTFVNDGSSPRVNATRSEISNTH